MAVKHANKSTATTARAGRGGAACWRGETPPARHSVCGGRDQRKTGRAGRAAPEHLRAGQSAVCHASALAGVEHAPRQKGDERAGPRTQPGPATCLPNAGPVLPAPGPPILGGGRAAERRVNTAVTPRPSSSPVMFSKAQRESGFSKATLPFLSLTHSLIHSANIYGPLPKMCWPPQHWGTPVKLTKDTS